MPQRNDGDMACALNSGNEYGISSFESDSDDVELIFLKLTDSAFKAIEECVKCRVPVDSPRIQFDKSNEGHIHIPRANGGAQNFRFSMAPNADKEGPQAIFNCLQQTRHGTLQNMGHLPYKMKIHANEDVYETTRQRMKVNEEIMKQSQTRVIKTGPGMSRKSKKVEPVRPVSVQPRPTSQPKSEAMKKSLRERVVHLLAIRSYKKPELMWRLQSDGMKEKEKRDGVMEVLKQVAQMSNNVYYLQRHAWEEVRSDWPFYTDNDREQLDKRRPRPANVPDIRGSQSPVNNVMRNSLSTKRTHPEPPATSKKPRLSRCKPKEQLSPMRPSNSPAPRNGVVSNGAITNGCADKSPPVFNDESLWNGKDRPKGADTPDSVCLSSSSSSAGESPDQEVSTDYLENYLTISGLEQRCMYKAEFNALYDEYKRLHESVDKVCSRFTVLKHQLRKLKSDTDEYQKLQTVIKEDYDRTLRNCNYIETRRRFEYLHHKLAHIKKLVSDYDRLNNV